MTHYPLNEIPPYCLKSVSHYAMEDANYSYASVSNFAVSFFNNALNIIKDKRLIPTILVLDARLRSVAKLEKLTVMELSVYKVYAPSYIEQNLPAYVSLLTEVLTGLASIDKDFLQPLELWLAKMLSDKEFIHKTWLALPPLSETVEKNTTALSSYFDKMGSSEMSTQLFNALYGSIPAYKQCCIDIDKLVDTTGHLLNGRIVDRANNITRLIKEVQKKTELTKTLSELPPNKLTQIHDAVYGSARAIELMAICLFQVRTLSWTQQRTIDKINNELK